MRTSLAGSRSQRASTASRNPLKYLILAHEELERTAYLRVDESRRLV